MASLNQLVSEIVHVLGEPNNHALRETVKRIVIHERNEKIRRSFENHKYVDKILEQRFVVSLTDVHDGDVNIPSSMAMVINKIKRTTQKVPRPVRLTNNLPFNEISTIGAKSKITLPFITEARSRFRGFVPGLCGTPCWDYINDYVYIFPIGNSNVDNVEQLSIKAAFENPKEVARINLNGEETFDFELDDDEWFLPDDMVVTIKESIFKRNLVKNEPTTNELN